MSVAVKTVRLTDIPAPAPAEPGSFEWKPVRRHFGILSFGINANVAARTGDEVVVEHDEAGTGHEELYYVAAGSARFRVGDEEIEAPAGSFVFVGDPKTVRSAKATAPSTSVIAIGGKPGAAFTISDWEKE